MYDLGVAAPIQSFIDRERFDGSNLEPNILAQYSIEGKLYSMPFSASGVMLYYNASAFRSAG